MKSLYIAFCFALALFCGCISASPTVAVAAAPKPWTEADSEALEDIVTIHLLPMMDAVSTAVTQISTDQPKACVSAKEAQGHNAAADTALAAMTDRLRAEGKDLQPMARVTEKMAELKTRVPQMVEAFCSRDAAMGGTPEEQAEARTLMGFVQQYTTAMNGALKAMTEEDDAGRCASLADAARALDKLDGFVVELRAKYRDSAEAIAQLDTLGGQITAWRDSAIDRRTGCPGL